VRGIDSIEAEMPVNSPQNSAYRADVDGLRAVAVLSVIVYHFDPKLLPSGFVGVDVFFVISGFVVTSALLRAETGSPFHDLMEFWRRRFLRILPALITMVIVSTVVFSVFFAPTPKVTYDATIRTGFASLFGIGNVYLVRLSADYFQSDQSINVFLHTWSLGVEEQFYLLYAVIFLLLSAFFKKMHARIVRIAVVGMLSLISVFLFFWGDEAQQTSTYYLLPTRFWELGIGCLIAFYRIQLAPSWIVRAVCHSAQIIGVGLLAAAMAMSQSEAAVFTWPIALAVTGATLLIAFGDGFRGIVIAVLASRPMTTIGLLSYSLYLWHWPVLTVYRHTVGLASPATIFTACASIAAISLASYYFVENPLRHARLEFRRGVLPTYGVSLILAFTVILALSRFPGAPFVGASQDWTDWRPGASFSYTDDGKITEQACSLHGGQMPRPRIPAECQSLAERKPGNSGTRLLAVGDSHSFALWGMLKYLSEVGGFDVAAFSHDGCSPFNSFYARTPSCRAYLQDLPDLIRREVSTGDVVLLSNFIPYREQPFKVAEADRFYAAISDAVRDTGARVVVEAPLPQFEKPAYLCLAEWFRTDFTGCVIRRSDFEIDRRPAMEWLAAHVAKSAGATTIFDSAEHVCNAAECQAVNGTHPILRDRNHLSRRAAAALGPYFLEFLREQR
jgi:peptidoglycan/LPS O-acetylase OafA/YrhL